jgi:RNA recognition motif-containing protein
MTLSVKGSQEFSQWLRNRCGGAREIELVASVRSSYTISSQFFDMNKKLYIGGLPYSTTEESLRAAFSKAGAVESAVIIKDKMTGRSRGFGFVEMASTEEAQKAIEMWHGQDFEGRTLTVNEARALEQR